MNDQLANVHTCASSDTTLQQQPKFVLQATEFGDVVSHRVVVDTNVAAAALAMADPNAITTDTNGNVSTSDQGVSRHPMRTRLQDGIR